MGQYIIAGTAYFDSIFKKGFRNRILQMVLLGAGSRQLIFQFICEVFLLSLAAAVSAAMLIQIILPVFNSLSGKMLKFQHLISLDHIIIYVAASILLSTLSRIYPAFYMGSFKPISSLKGLKVSGSGRTKVRNWPVLFPHIPVRGRLHM